MKKIENLENIENIDHIKNIDHLKNIENIKIIGSIGAPDNRSLLCEIPQSLASLITINHDGEVGAFEMIKLLRSAYMKAATKNPQDLQNQKTKSPESSKELNKKDRETLYHLIFDQKLAVDDPKIDSEGSPGEASWK